MVFLAWQDSYIFLGCCFGTVSMRTGKLSFPIGGNNYNTIRVFFFLSFFALLFFV